MIPAPCELPVAGPFQLLRFPSNATTRELTMKQAMMAWPLQGALKNPRTTVKQVDRVGTEHDSGLQSTHPSGTLSVMSPGSVDGRCVR